MSSPEISTGELAIVACGPLEGLKAIIEQIEDGRIRARAAGIPGVYLEFDSHVCLKRAEGTVVVQPASLPGST